MQVQIQALLAAGGGGARGTERGMIGSNMGPQVEMAKPAIFNGEVGKVEGFVTMYRLYLKMKMREAMVEEHVLDFVTCTGRISGCLERERDGGVRGRRVII